jgi:ribosomal protein S18 acetylase RimI-like enzyme
MNAYMTDEMGGKLSPLEGDKAKKLVEGLEKHPSKLVLLAREGNHYVGLTNCFINFGTFAVKPFINIHDIVVLSSYRGKGIGRLLMQQIEQQARHLDCAKITLEVREDNHTAQHLYQSMEYQDCTPPMFFWTKYLQ